MAKFSLIIPVFNRPEEIDELLKSLLDQTIKAFEVIIVEDGSDNDCEEIVNNYRPALSIHYYKISNSGPGQARNFGAKKSIGDWVIFLDSDTLIPKDYLKEVEEFLSINKVDAFGGADRDKDDFLPIQRAISYSMTSFLTTGGIRGKSKSLERFKPRSFNMGIKKVVFEQLGGFGKMRYGEDVDFSLRIEAANFKTAFVPKAFVYHKRRTSFSSFFKQIMHSGEARIMLSRLHPGSFKLVHFFPVLFVFGVVFSLLAMLFLPKVGALAIVIYLSYFMIIGVHSVFISKSLQVGFLSIIASFVQLSAYGYGFLKARILTSN